MGHDKLSLERINTLHPKLRAEAAAIYTEANNKLGKTRLRFSHTFRSIQEQNELYAKGRTKKGPIVTNAKGGQSYHNYGLAVDIVLLLDKDNNGSFETASWDYNTDWDKDGTADWLEVVKVFQKYGWQWGFWKNGKHWDKPHFQKTFGYSIGQLQQMLMSKKVDCKGYVKL